MEDWREKLSSIITDNEISEEPILGNGFWEGVIDSVLVQDSGVAKKSIFLTEFSPDDVNDFIKILKSIRPEYHRNDLGVLLEKEINNWCVEHPTRCPYEPFLWALKITDGYIGSIQYNASPQTWRIEEVCKSMMSIWSKEPIYFNIIKNIILTWDWYQPVHVALALYGELNDINDDETDKYICEHWLLRLPYSGSAFNTLIKKRKTKNNIQALMNFVSQDQQTELNNAKIQITRRNRDALSFYIRHTSQDEYAIAHTYYNDSLYNCSRNARIVFEEIFNEVSETSIPEYIKKWKKISNSGSSNDLNRLKIEIFNMFENNDRQIITLAGRSGDHQLISEVLDIIEHREFSFKTQFIFKAMLDVVAGCGEYRNYIQSKLTPELLSQDTLSNKEFVYCCAYCCLGKNNLVNRLIKEFYTKGIGGLNAKYLFLHMKTIYPEQYNKCIDEIVASCSNDIPGSINLINNCSKVCDAKTQQLYPIAFDKICDQLMTEICAEGSDALRCAKTLLSLYDSIVTPNNRSRYYQNLQKIIETKSHLLESAREQANKKIIEVYMGV